MLADNTDNFFINTVQSILTMASGEVPMVTESFIFTYLFSSFLAWNWIPLKNTRGNTL